MSQQLPHYVYELIDVTVKDSPKVLYVGKGVGSRVKDHAKKVAAKIKLSKEVKDDKEIVIKQLLEKAKVSPTCLKELVIGRYATKEEAFAVESTLIKWIYGHRHLTNKVHGHHADQIRENGDYDFNSDLEPLAYMSQRRHNIATRGIKGVAETLKESLIDMGFEDIFIAGLIGQDFSLLWKVPGFPIVVQLKLQENNQKVVLNARPSMQIKMDNKTVAAASKKSNYLEFLALMGSAGYLVSARDNLKLTFSALFESNFKTGANWGKSNQKNIFALTGKNIVRRTSFQDGISASNAEMIGSYLRDLEIRLMIAKEKLNIDNVQEHRPQFLKSLIKIFQSKPATKYISSSKSSINLF